MSEEHSEEHNGSRFMAPGTFVLALIFLATFIAVYFLNIKYLAGLWELH